MNTDDETNNEQEGSSSFNIYIANDKILSKVVVSLLII